VSTTTPSNEKPVQSVVLPVDLRDYFAAKALPTLLREYRDEVEAGGTGFNVSEAAYAIADAMLKARAA